MVKTPFALMFMRGGSKRDCRRSTTPQPGLGGRTLNVPRGKMLGGSGSINSMVWFRGCMDDFDGWGVEGWSSDVVEEPFEEVEARMTPQRLAHPHPLSQSLARALDSDGQLPPSPEREGAGAIESPAIGLHHVGAGSGYGLTFRQLPAWAIAPFSYLFARKGPLASNLVEAGA